MPDDFFNQQQNQRKPRYAAGSDIDSIYTGREVPEGGFRQKKKIGCLPKIILAVLIITVIFKSLPSEPVKGNIGGKITDYYYSDDKSNATIEAHIVNETNKTVYNIQLTYNITDNGGNTLARETVTLPDELAVGESLNYITIIETPSRPTGYTTANIGIKCKYKP